MGAMSLYTNGPAALPTGHTVTSVTSTTYFKNLKLTLEKLTAICQKIQAIKDSLVDASGSDINKVNDDLDTVYRTFNNLRQKIDNRGGRLIDNANDYDKLYERERRKIGNKYHEQSYTTNAGSTYALLMYRCWDTLHEIKDVINDVTYGADGFIYLDIKRDERIVDRQNKDIFALSNFGESEMEEVSDPKTITTHYRVRVLANGTYLSLEHEPTFMPLNN